MASRDNALVAAHERHEDYRRTLIELQRVLHVLERHGNINDQHPMSHVDRCRCLWQRLQALADATLVPSHHLAPLQKRVEHACLPRSKEPLHFATSGRAPPSSRVVTFVPNAEPSREKQNGCRAPAAGSDGRGCGDAENAKTDAKSLQKQQREQMEAEILELAMRMREETSRMHEALQFQTATLIEDLSQVAIEKVADTTQVAQDVRRHAQHVVPNRTANSCKSLLTAVGCFAFTLLLVLMAPKRQNVPCLFYCHSRNTNRPPAAAAATPTMIYTAAAPMTTSCDSEKADTSCLAPRN